LDLTPEIDGEIFSKKDFLNYKILETATIKIQNFNLFKKIKLFQESQKKTEPLF